MLKHFANAEQSVVRNEALLVSNENVLQFEVLMDDPSAMQSNPNPGTFGWQ